MRCDIQQERNSATTCRTRAPLKARNYIYLRSKQRKDYCDTRQAFHRDAELDHSTNTMMIDSIIKHHGTVNYP